MSLAKPKVTLKVGDTAYMKVTYNRPGEGGLFHVSTDLAEYVVVAEELLALKQKKVCSLKEVAVPPTKEATVAPQNYHVGDKVIANFNGNDECGTVIDSFGPAPAYCVVYDVYEHGQLGQKSVLVGYEQLRLATVREVETWPARIISNLYERVQQKKRRWDAAKALLTMHSEEEEEERSDDRTTVETLTPKKKPKKKK